MRVAFVNSYSFDLFWSCCICLDFLGSSQVWPGPPAQLGWRWKPTRCRSSVQCGSILWRCRPFTLRKYLCLYLPGRDSYMFLLYSFDENIWKELKRHILYLYLQPFSSQQYFRPWSSTVSTVACKGLYDRGCDNWLTLCNVNFTLEHEEGSCSYLKQVQNLVPVEKVPWELQHFVHWSTCLERINVYQSDELINKSMYIFVSLLGTLESKYCVVDIVAKMAMPFWLKSPDRSNCVKNRSLSGYSPLWLPWMLRQVRRHERQDRITLLWTRPSWRAWDCTTRRRRRRSTCSTRSWAPSWRLLPFRPAPQRSSISLSRLSRIRKNRCG